MKSKIDNALMRTLRNEGGVNYVPIWEVWFGMTKLAERIAGGPIDAPEKWLPVARRLVWESLIVNYAFTPLSALTVWKEASDGTSHYVPVGIDGLRRMLEVPFPDYDKIAEETSHALTVAHDNNMAGVFYLLWPFHGINTAVGLEQFAYAMVDEPELVSSAFDFLAEWNRAYIQKVIIPCRVDFVLFDGDCAYKTGLMVSPQMFHELVYERTKKTVSLLADADIPYTFHSDGKVDEFIAMLIELGFAGVHGIEAAANDLGEIKERFGKDITLIGNMDVGFLTHATVEEVKKKTLQMIDIGSAGGRYIAACNTSPLDYIPEENYLAMIETIKAYHIQNS